MLWRMEPGKLWEEVWVIEEGVVQKAGLGMNDTETLNQAERSGALQGNLRGSRVVPDRGTADFQLPQ